MPEVPFSTYAGALDATARKAFAPVSCTFEITPVCNLRCHFCYVAIDPYRGPYLDTAHMQRALDVIAEAGVLFLTLTGGEIFARRDFLDIYRYARGKGFIITLFTNATMVTPEHARVLADEPPHAVEVSIYGADAEHYEGTTGIPGSFVRFERGVQLLQEAGLDPLLKHPVSTLTADHLPAIHAWCDARGLRHKFSAELERRHDGGEEPTLYRIGTRQVPVVKDDLYALRTGRKRELPMPECAPSPDADPRELYQCSAGRSTFFVDALGNASHCVIDREPSFPLLEMPWPELWARMNGWVTQPLAADAACGSCALRAACNNCPARARLATGSPHGRDPYHCEITHLEHGVPWGGAAARPRRELGACVA